MSWAEILKPNTWVESLKASSWMGLAEAFMPRSMRDTSNPIVPPDSVSGRALTVVIAIMCFLACLTAGAVYMVYQSAAAWSQDLASEITVQINPAKDVDLDKQVTLVSLFLAKQAGIERVAPLTAEQSAALLEPWLGQNAEITALPVPRLIAIELDRSQPPNLDALRSALESTFPAAKLDDHRRWQAEIRTVTRSLALGGVTVLILVATATISTIVTATRSAMASNREIIEVLHIVGAKDRFIATEFEKHFLIVGIRAGLMGALAAAFVFVLMPIFLRSLGQGSLAAAEFRRLLGPAALDPQGYLVLVSVVIIVATLCKLTSRYGVYSILKSNE